MFTHKVVLVTGGSQGIGHCIATRFKQAGATVAVLDKTHSPTSWDLFYQGDIADETVLQGFVQQVVAKYGKVDYLINNACLSKGGILDSCSYEDFLYVQKVGVVAPYLLARLCMPHFAKGSAIVNISSSRWAQSQPNTESYTAAKGGITALTHALAVSLAGQVRVNAIAPGWIDNTQSQHSTPDHAQHPAGRVGTPDDIAQMTLFLCGAQAGFITGQCIAIDGGMSKLMVYHNDCGWEYK